MSYKKLFILASVICVLSLGYSGYLMFKLTDRRNNEKGGEMIIENISIKEDDLKRRILEGDTLAYLKLRDIYVDRDIAPDFLLWSLIMSNKYSYPVANYDVYFSFQQVDAYYNHNSSNISLDLLDSSSRVMAISYLIESSKNGDLQAKKILSEYYLLGKYLPQNVEVAKKLKLESNE